MFSLMLVKLLVFLLRHASCLVGGDLQRVFSSGDIIIGGLFPIHSQVIINKTGPPTKMCDPKSLDIQMLICSQAMIYAIEQINQDSLLPNVKIGYEIYDTCSSVSMALHGTLKLMKKKTFVEDQCVVMAPSNNVKAVIGERSSEVSVAVARLLALPLMTQISFASSSELLSSRSKFPSFFRTVPSDKHQTDAIVQLVQWFNFVPVGIIGSDDEYGKYGAESLSDSFKKNNICIEFKEILPADFSKNHLVFTELQKKLSSWRAEAIVLFTKASNAKIILEEASSVNASRTWIASDAWSTAKDIINLDKLSNSVRILGITCKRHKVPGFSDYMTHFLNQENMNGSFFCNLLSLCPFCTTQPNNQTCPLFASEAENMPYKQHFNRTSLIDFIHQDESYEAYSVYMAVNVIAHGLKSLLENNNVTHFPPRMLTEAIQQVRFTLSNFSNISLNKHGEVDLGYDILEWKTEGKINIYTIGTYENSSILLHKVFPENKTVTQFNCSKSCLQGQELYVMHPDNPCCKGCISCKKNYFSTDGNKCEPCQESNHSQCFREKFLPWTNGFSITLAVFTSINLVITLLVTVLFSLNIHTPIVRAAGGYMCFPALLSLMGCFSSVFLFLGEPTEANCRAGLPFFSLSFTVCVSCVLANLLQIFVGFAFTLKLGYWLKRVNKPVVVVMVCASVQVFLCALWLVLGPPSQKMFEDGYILECDEGSVVFFVLSQVYIALLCIVCFTFAYKGRTLPGLYKNARFVAIGMLIYLVMWVIFIPVYTQEHGMHERAIKASAILVSGFSILGCHFAPKCFILLWKKELNDENAIAEHIRKHLEKKDIKVLS
ncbi:G-protein coupled receptor family C group 6 member A-like [Salminus brasiliensis]|uniref:G-protein coupled receptor family C group 6 member A-like n=1 Tax=Salminus brasiliensis TaxID=930266 RepID=UPI003B831117